VRELKQCGSAHVPEASNSLPSIVAIVFASLDSFASCWVVFVSSLTLDIVVGINKDGVNSNRLNLVLGNLNAESCVDEAHFSMFSF
jgi:hypothetical protein